MKFELNALNYMSLRRRIFLSSGVVLVFFLAVVALVVKGVYSISLEKIVLEKLKVKTYQLISVADVKSGVLSLPTRLQDPRYNSSSSTSLAFVSNFSHDLENSHENIIWRSLSAKNKFFSFLSPGEGQWFFGRAKSDDGTQYYVSSYKAVWVGENGSNEEFVFTLMEGLDYYRSELSGYQTIFFAGLIGFALTFFSLQALILQWGLRPIRTIATDVDLMKNGRSEYLSGQYPRELQPLINNLNTLVDNERQQRDRYRERMADLSHSLKTPLSVLRGAASDVDQNGDPISKEALVDTLEKQVKKMMSIVEYQLQRALASGVPTRFPSVTIDKPMREVIETLDKVYCDKKVYIEINISPELCFMGDVNDLTEMLGNLLDNAYKNCASRVRVSAFSMESQQLLIVIENDGSNIPPEKRESVMRRGVRLDSSSEGHGFGLSITAEIALSYKGDLSIQDSTLGGAYLALTIPGK